FTGAGRRAHLPLVRLASFGSTKLTYAVSGTRPALRRTAMVRNHQPGQAIFRSILPEDIDWKPFPAFPPSVRLAVVVGRPSEPWPLYNKGQGAIRGEADATQTSGGPRLHGHFWHFLHRSRRSV